MWGIQRGTSVIPKSVNPSRIEGNFQLDGWELTPEEVKTLSSLKGRFKVCDGTFLGGAKIFYDDDE